jgi:hypothetical protein
LDELYELDHLVELGGGELGELIPGDLLGDLAGGAFFGEKPGFAEDVLRGEFEGFGDGDEGFGAWVSLPGQDTRYAGSCQAGFARQVGLCPASLLELIVQPLGKI